MTAKLFDIAINDSTGAVSLLVTIVCFGFLLILKIYYELMQ